MHRSPRPSTSFGKVGACACARGLVLHLLLHGFISTGILTGSANTCPLDAERNDMCKTCQQALHGGLLSSSMNRPSDDVCNVAIASIPANGMLSAPRV